MGTVYPENTETGRYAVVTEECEDNILLKVDENPEISVGQCMQCIFKFQYLCGTL